MGAYIVTGGAGFIGSKLAEKLIAGNNNVIILDNLFSGYRENIPSGAEFLEIDISQKEQLENCSIPDDIEAVFHLAAQSSGEASFDDPLLDLDYNYKGTLNMLELCKRKKIKRFLFSSSMSVYGNVPEDIQNVSEDHTCNPVSYYGCHKLASENLIKIYSARNEIEYTIFRLFNVYGPGQNMRNMKQGMVSIYLAFLMNDLPINVKGNLKRFRDFVYIDDVVDAFLRSVNLSKSFNETINMATGIKTDVGTLIQTMLKIYNRTPFEKWTRIEGSTPGDVNGLIADISKLKECLGWIPQSTLELGLQNMIDWAENTKIKWRNGIE